MRELIRSAIRERSRPNLRQPRDDKQDGSRIGLSIKRKWCHPEESEHGRDFWRGDDVEAVTRALDLDPRLRLNKGFARE